MTATEPVRVMLVYWGRRGMAQFVYEAAQAAVYDPAIAACVCVSTSNEEFDRFNEFGEALLPIDTFDSTLGALSQAWRIPSVRRQFARHLRTARVEIVIELMSHVWAPLLMPVARRLGVRYATIVHDADPHPGDWTTIVKRWIDRGMTKADVILTLSDSVTSRLGRLGVPATTPSVTLFHPDLRYVERPAMLSLRADAPIKLLFLGRILHYKGLPLFLDAAQRLRDEGLAIEVGVFGEGDTSACTAQLQALDVELVNRWLTNAEIADALGRYHAVVLSHTSASQSGVVATAHGAGLPVVVTPVGGLLEQVEHGVTGLIAERADVSALTDSMRELCAPARYRELLRGVAASRTARSMPRFIRACVAAASGVDIRGEQ